MMLATPTGEKNPAALNPQPHPRRLPAHLSVSLRHGYTSLEGTPSDTRVSWKGRHDLPMLAYGKSSGESNHSGASGGKNVRKWFDLSNERSHTHFPTALEDNEPPYFLPQDSSSTSNDVDDLGIKQRQVQPRPNPTRAGTTGSGSSDDYRSVIDDLTIENRKLKQRLRKFETSHSPHLDKDRLFEVKVHGLPSRKKRELEELLRAFASSMGGSESSGDSKERFTDDHTSPSLKHTIKSSSTDQTSLSTSNSRPADSAYASMSNSGPTSSSPLKPASQDWKDGQSTRGTGQNIQTFLHNIPEGLLPKHSPVMTERQKKKYVVRRLEQLFTGRTAGIVGEHSQPLQQQEVSRSAARADQIPGGGPVPMEGVREAHILADAMGLDGKPKFRNGSGISSDVTQASRSASDSSDESSLDKRSGLNQRPTRPLDLDPDRAQVPSENVEYIRHLGLSTPQLASEDFADASSDAEGWTYLNLLVNMAQLHIINVTSDFVRSAVAEVSEKFQLSEDGNKVRWRGGSRGTKLSSDSGVDSARTRSPDDTDSLEEDNPHKRRKANVGRLAPIPAIVKNGSENDHKTRKSSNAFHYKPLFRHSSFSSGEQMSSDGSDDVEWHENRRKGLGSAWNAKGSTTGPSRKRRRDDGPIIFYTGAGFYTDLSGDRGNISIPSHVTDVGRDGYSNQSQHAVGCRPPAAIPFSRTNSGSLLPFRPFKDYSKVPECLLTAETRCKTPELFVGDCQDEKGFFINESTSTLHPPISLQDFEASGLGGTQPADHFAVIVKTRLSSKRFAHNNSKPSLASVYAADTKELEESIIAQLASLTTFSAPSPQKSTQDEDLPVQTQVLQEQFVRLDPSPLPPPLGYDCSVSSSEGDSESSSSSSGIYQPQRHRIVSVSDPDEPIWQFSTSDAGDESDEDDELSDDGDDDSIDILAHARGLDPAAITAREQEFDREVDEEASSLFVRSSAATVDTKSGYSSDD